MVEIRTEQLEASVLFDTVSTCREKGLPDMYVALAHYISDSNRPELLELYHDYRQFWAEHHEHLEAAYPDFDAFVAAFAECVNKECVNNEC